MRYTPEQLAKMKADSTPQAAPKKAAKKAVQPTTHDAAQRKVWMAERKAVAASIRKMSADSRKEFARIEREIGKLQKKRRWVIKTMDREQADALRRLAILNGRLGL